MKKKYNNDSDLLADWTTKKIKEELAGYVELIDVIGCYGSSDVRMLYGIESELYSRGIEL